MNLNNSKLIYRATERGFSGFHEVCDHRNNIAIIVKTNKNRVFGCYTQYGFGEEIPDSNQ